jgi:hypothetical protein
MELLFWKLYGIISLMKQQGAQSAPMDLENMESEKQQYSCGIVQDTIFMV